MRYIRTPMSTHETFSKPNAQSITTEQFVHQIKSNQSNFHNTVNMSQANQRCMVAETSQSVHCMGQTWYICC